MTAKTAQRRREQLRTVSILLTVVLVIAALVLLERVVSEANDDTTSADVGDAVPLGTELHGLQRTVQLPSAEVTVTVSDPVRSLDTRVLEESGDHDLLTAPDDGALVPVSWRVRGIGGVLGHQPDPNPIDLRLLAGDERIELDSVLLEDSSDLRSAVDPTSVAVALDEDVTADDLTVEITYDGLTQTIDVASGELDTGAARALYEDPVTYATGCDVGDRDTARQCTVSAPSGSPMRPDDASITAGHVRLTPYDPERGWAEEGKLWAVVGLRLSGTGDLESASGAQRTVRRQNAPDVTLDGRSPVRTDDLGRGGTSYGALAISGTAVFSVDADAELRELAIRQTYELEGQQAPRRLSVGAVLRLTKSS